MAIKKIEVTIIPQGVGETTSVEIFTDKPTEQIRGVEALKILNDAMQQILEQLVK